MTQSFQLPRQMSSYASHFRIYSASNFQRILCLSPPLPRYAHQQYVILVKLYSNICQLLKMSGLIIGVIRLNLEENTILLSFMLYLNRTNLFSSVLSNAEFISSVGLPQYMTLVC